MRTVAVQLDGALAHLAHEVISWAEAEAGWHLTTLEGPPAPQLVLAGAVVPDHATVVLVDGAVDAEQVDAGLRAGALDVLSWPGQRGRLLALGDRAVARQDRAMGRHPGARLLTVSGAGGGAGTSTVVLALAGLVAWSGRRALAVGGQDLLTLAGMAPWDGPGLCEVAQLDPFGAAEEVAMLARAVPGVPGLGALGEGSRRGDLSAGGDGRLRELVRPWPAEVVVADLRSSSGGTDLVVARPDRCLLAARGGAVAVVGADVLSPAAVRRLLGADPLVTLPWSARVARAGLAGRVPSALPGSWLRRLRPLLGELLRSTEARA